MCHTISYRFCFVNVNFLTPTNYFPHFFLEYLGFLWSRKIKIVQYAFNVRRLKKILSSSKIQRLLTNIVVVQVFFYINSNNNKKNLKICYEKKSIAKFNKKENENWILWRAFSSLLKKRNKNIRKKNDDEIRSKVYKSTLYNNKIFTTFCVYIELYANF